MRKVNLVCVGKIKERYFSDAVAEYAKRLSRFCRFSVEEVAESTLAREPNPAEAERLKDEEGERILRRAAGRVVALDRGGKQISSEELAALLAGESTEISFVIGGSYGLSAPVLARANERIAFGRVTYPHQLMRVIAAEQIYRAFMIGAGSTYHK